MLVTDRKFTINDAKDLAGLPRTWQMKAQADYDFAQEALKDRIIEARRNDKEELAARLSEARAMFKKRWGRGGPYCPKCGERKSNIAEFCQVCQPMVGSHLKYSSKQHLDMSTENCYEIRKCVLIPGRFFVSELMEAMEKLKTGEVGDSFVTELTETSIRSAAKKAGVQTITRTLKAPKGKKPLRGVWRTDGQKLEEVNKIIQQRIVVSA